jgi:hypothetical protein
MEIRGRHRDRIVGRDPVAERATGECHAVDESHRWMQLNVLMFLRIGYHLKALRREPAPR